MLVNNYIAPCFFSCSKRLLYIESIGWSASMIISLSIFWKYSITGKVSCVKRSSLLVILSTVSSLRHCSCALFNSLSIAFSLDK